MRRVFSAALLMTMAGAAHADVDVELGGAVGAHVFSPNGELGVLDEQPAEPELNSFLALGVRLGVGLGPIFGLEGELIAIPTDDDTNDGSNMSFDASVYGYRMHALAHLMQGRVRPFALLGIGAMTVEGKGMDDIVGSATEDDTDFVAHWGAGVKFAVTPAIALRADFRHFFMPSRESEGAVFDEFEITAGVGYVFGASSEPKEETTEIVTAPIDTDGDGLTDDVDKCPQEAEDKDSFQDDDGCPDADNDMDGILDASDKCPMEAETKNGIDDEDGCPENDEDGDGLVGSADKCPTEPEDKDGFQDDDGCPDPDNDGDGVTDANDKCQDKPETVNGFDDGDGCPDVIPEKVKKFTGVIQGIYFKRDSSDITTKSNRTLNKTVEVMNEYPTLRIEISGHTSSEGDPQHNMDLSQRRAESVKAYIVGKGIDTSRITTIGYGPDKPIADNKTKKGMAKNRRIEFRLIGAQETAPPAGPAAPAPAAPAPKPPK